ncbi:hypothetical protein [Halorubrum trueperi]|uniref:PGF-CTERM sorting domain-containing protein n=1 Tax=Halorubrum trueperi TaxID=2004704 RepID=A0ABD5UIL6_9EURY
MNGTLPPGSYEIAVRSEHGNVATTNETAVTLRNRSTSGVAAYTTSTLDPAEFGSGEAVRNAITNGTLSRSSTIADNDTVVYGVNASGLTGLPETKNVTLATGADLDGVDGFAFGIRSRDAESGELNATNGTGDIPENATVHLDESGLYLVADAADALATDDRPADDEAFTAAFRVNDDRLREATADPESDHTVTANLTYSRRTQTEDAETTSVDGDLDGEGAVDGGGTGGGEVAGGGTGGGVASGDAGGIGTGGGTGGAGGTGGGAGGGDTIGSAGGSGTRGDANSSDGSGGSDRTAGSSPPTDTPGTQGDLPNGDRFGVRPAADLRSAAPSTSVAVLTASAAERRSNDTDARAVRPAASDGRTAAAENATGESADSPATPNYEDAPIRTTADDVPGFGPLTALGAIVGASLLVGYRRRVGL